MTRRRFTLPTLVYTRTRHTTVLCLTTVPCAPLSPDSRSLYTLLSSSPLPLHVTPYLFPRPNQGPTLLAQSLFIDTVRVLSTML